MASKITPLSRAQKTVAALIACVMLLLASYLFVRPPNRVTIESSEEGKTKRTSAHAEPSAVVIAVFSAGIALLLYSINGLQLTRLSAGGIDVEAQDINDPKSAAGVEGKKEADALLKKTDDHWAKFAENFYQLSSWNGKKVLYACYLSAQTKRSFSLRTLCDEDKRMSFDYAYGYLIAANSAGFLVQKMPSNGDTITVEIFNSYADTLFKHIQGHLSLPPEDRENKVREIYLIAARFGVSPPDFVLDANPVKPA